MPLINITIRPERSVLLNYVSNEEERYSQWPLNGRNFRAYGFGVAVIRSLAYKDDVDRETRDDNIVPTALLLENSDGDTMQVEFSDEKLIISRTQHTVTHSHPDLIQGDIIQTLNGVTSPTFEMVYKVMSRGETLEMEVIRGGGELLVDHIPKKAKLRHDVRLDINCLPDTVFELVSSFIPTFVDRLLLAGAVCMPSSTSIIGLEPVHELDFVDIDKHVAARLNDDDIRRMLTCIDAVNNIVSMKLTNCFRVVGHGLEPLKGSKLLELIDLSLVAKHASPNIDDKKPLISIRAILPILESILARGRLCNLKYVQYPERWRRNLLLRDFNLRLAGSQTIQHLCVYCCQEKSNTELSQACYLCLEHLCYECIERDLAESHYDCDYCSKTYCDSCVEGAYRCESNRCDWKLYCEVCSKWCSRCGNSFCVECASFVDCDNCGVLYCGYRSAERDCIGDRCDECQWNICSSCTHVNRCYYCNKTCCGYCEDTEGSDVLHCICHDKEICSECLARRENRSSLCQDCVARVDNYLDGCLWR